jgi:hypothetical protein
MGLIDDNGDELSGGELGYEYARVPVLWSAPNESDEIHPTESPVFNVPGGDTVVAGWRSYDAATAGNNLGGKDLSPARTYEGQGTLLLDKDQMGWRFV